MTEVLKRTPLYENHVALKARMVPFGGWDMPVQYAGLMKEHHAVRENIGLFDVCHMGEFLISGKEARSFLDKMLTNEIQKLSNGRCQYNLMCYENGTVVDDVIVSQLEDEKYLVVVNAANIEKDFEWLQKHLTGDVKLENKSDEYGLIAVQGMQAPLLMKEVFGSDFSDVKYYHFTGHLPKSADKPVKENVWISRTGYTGEDGFEVLVHKDQASELWNLFLEYGKKLNATPCGLGARDTLRLEVAFSLYGHEISDQIYPLEARLGWVIKLQKDADFIGKKALIDLKERGLSRKLVGFELLDRAIARENCKVFDVQDQEIGYVTSGTHSPTLKKAIGLALVKSEFSDLDQEVFIDVRGKKKKAKIIRLPFYKKM